MKVEFEKNNAEHEVKKCSISEAEEIIQVHGSGYSANGTFSMRCQARLREIKQKITRCGFDISKCEVEMKNTHELLQEKIPHVQIATSRHDQSLQDLANIKARMDTTNVMPIMCFYNIVLYHSCINVTAPKISLSLKVSNYNFRKKPV